MDQEHAQPRHRGRPRVHTNNAERLRNYRQLESSERREARLSANAEQQRRRRESKTLGMAPNSRVVNAERQRQRRQNEDVESAQLGCWRTLSASRGDAKARMMNSA